MSDKIPEKPFKQYSEQIRILKSRGLEINDTEFAVHALKIYSYYDLINGNTDELLLSKKPDVFKPGTNFQILVQIRILEDRLKSVFLNQILMIEKTFKSVLSYYIAEHFGVDNDKKGYLDSTHYSMISSQKKSTGATLKKLRHICLGEVPHPERQGTPLLYYRENHNHIPPWILIDELTLGETMYWFKALKSIDKGSLAHQLLPETFILQKNVNGTNLFLESIDLIREFRNFFAHNSVLSQMKSSRQVQLNKIDDAFENELIHRDELEPSNYNNLFACFFCIILLSQDADQLRLFQSQIQAVIDLAVSADAGFIVTNIFKLPIDIASRIDLLFPSY